MNRAAVEEFTLAPGLILLNHASYGLASRRVLTAGNEIRAEIESDPTARLGAALTGTLRDRTRRVAGVLGLDAERVTLCSNATSAAAALIGSLPLVEGDTVVVLDTEYASVRRAWELACTRRGARLVQVPVPLPLDDPGRLLRELDAHAPGRTAYLQASLISSSAAIALPVTELAAWARRRGGELILDAAHGPGHVPLAPDRWGVTAMFGTLHKWLPTLRPVGFLWLTKELIDRVRPAEVSLTWDSDDLIERFSWPGTFDPTPRLCINTALAQWIRWRDEGRLAACERLASTATEVLTDIGARPTASTDLLPPRMRAFIVNDVSVAETKAALADASVRAWVGPDPAGRCLLRIATHIYNDRSDIDTLADLVQEVLAR